MITPVHPPHSALKTQYSVSEPLPPAQENLNRFMAHSGQFTILQDTANDGHGNNDGYAKHNALTFLAEPQTMQVLSRNGVTALAMEVRHEFQPLADGVASGKMTPEQFAQGIANMYHAAGDQPGSIPSQRNIEVAKVIQAASRNGIRVLCVENQAANLKEHGAEVDRLGNADKMFSQIATDHVGLSDVGTALMQIATETVSDLTHGSIFPTAHQQGVQTYSERIIQAIASSPTDADIAQWHKHVQEDRLSNDEKLGHSISAAVKGQKTVVFYGSAHGESNCTLNHYLGDARRIGIYTDEGTLKADTQRMYMMGLKRPDAAIALDSGALFAAHALDALTLKDKPTLPKAFVPNNVCKF